LLEFVAIKKNKKRNATLKKKHAHKAVRDAAGWSAGKRYIV
jgi:hypothetical protein